MARPLFSVFTATHNRAHTLARPYQALVAQTMRSFEWIVVDDGSTDDTESLVHTWEREASFPIRYVSQPRGGKHRAYNVGVRLAEGTLFLCLDSDDACVPWALERLRQYWEDIPEIDRRRHTGVTVLAQDPTGNVIGDPFPGAPISLGFFEMLTRYRVTGDKWGFHRTAVLREFPFPEIEGEMFLSEALVWNRIARRYLMRFVNDPLLTVHYQTDGLSARSIIARVQAPRGAMLVYRELAAAPAPFRARFRASVNLLRFAIHAGELLSEVWGRPDRRGLTLSALPVSVVLYLRDRWRLRDLGRPRRS